MSVGNKFLNKTLLQLKRQIVKHVESQNLPIEHPKKSKVEIILNSGLKGHSRKARDGRNPRKSTRNKYSATQTPSSFDWRTYNVITSIKDQG
jgi:C1A family cysteine protease